VLSDFGRYGTRVSDNNVYPTSVLYLPMKVVTTFHPPSAVLCSLKCKLDVVDSNREHLVVAKLNRLDVFSCRPDGLHHECGLEVWGRILSIKAIPVKVSLSGLFFGNASRRQYRIRGSQTLWS
jgi:hypothetical protein